MKPAFAVCAAVCLIVTIAACSRDEEYAQPAAQVVAQPQVVAQQPVYAAPPVVVQQAPAHDGFFTGMLMGHLMSGGGCCHSSHSNTTVVKNVTVNKTYVRPAPMRYAPIRSYSYRSSSSSFRSSGFRRR
ncbi:TPA: hypothetical protein QDB10_002192 [Burkholderia vietnamiensis]|nr:hypothetical protein [Burkholderia vietnamiensis]